MVVLSLATGFASVGSGEAGAISSTGGASAPSEAAPPPERVAASPAVVKSVHPSGVATWFGPGFYGKKTACGQTLTPSVVGVANRTLPCGTLVKVAYKNRTVILPVLDRGPYSHIADWDLTAGAAHALGVSDTVRIKTRVVGLAPNTPTLGLPATAPAPATPAETAAGGAVAG